MDYLALVMFPVLLVALFLGFPVAFSMMGVAIVFGYFTFGDAVIFQFAADERHADSVRIMLETFGGRFGRLIRNPYGVALLADQLGE